MNKIIVKDTSGNIHKLEAENGFTLMEIIRDAGLEIEAACGGCCACATCHIYIHKDWLVQMPRKEMEEESMLDLAFNLKPESRLGCQITFKDEFNGLKIELPKE